MRDLEFKEAYVKYYPKLHRMFSVLIRSSHSGTDKAIEPTDLIQLTLMEAYENICKPGNAKYTAEELIFLKARNICSEYLKPPKKNLKSSSLEHVLEKQNPQPDPLQQLILKEEIANLSKQIDAKIWKTVNFRYEGYSYAEVECFLSTSKGSLKTQICQMREKIKMKYLR